MSTHDKLEEIKKIVTEIENDITQLEGINYQIPGIKLAPTYYNHKLIKNIPDPNKLLLEATRQQITGLISYLEGHDYSNPEINGTLQKYGTEIVDMMISFLGLTKGNTEISQEYEKLYYEFIRTASDSEILIQPTIGALRDDKNIYTSIYFFENYAKEMTKDDFDIYQNFSIGPGGRSQLSYYVCFNRQDKERGGSYRMHKFTVKNLEIEYATFNSKTKTISQQPLDINNIENVMVSVIDVDPKASRGTVTTVKPTGN
ncbi:hypothetical protein [uncultured Kordia sp.]|uniref:hypothetical protein n=1 Tax=uncultured Kordia sp. TaxID=507699 RepID=UPI0026038E0E|nr:hypothetical protein [uncultured Kordia sp.]